ncbi:hypothetical protein AB0H51_11430 [Streptomyces griseoluteus]|uniref:hypothetical protein n=1 Tax=Streptomyces griseoluteus TaxID=29306 RepID=UPI0033C4C51D
MLFITVLGLTALVAGLATTWLVHGPYGWPTAIAAGAAVATSVPALALCSLILYPPLGYALAAVAVFAALRAYDGGRVISATGWAAVATTALACAHWGRG